MKIRNLITNLARLFDDPESIKASDIAHLLKAERNKALQEAIDVCEMWKKECKLDLDREQKEYGTMYGFGKINILSLCVQRIEEKITGVRRWG